MRRPGDSQQAIDANTRMLREAIEARGGEVIHIDDPVRTLLEAMPATSSPAE
jgi:hypothetical protein